MAELIFRNATILTMDDDNQIFQGDVASVDDKLVHIGGDYTPQSKEFQIIDCQGCVVMPGLIQSHTHLCQTLARGIADDLELLPWLEQKIWPYEAALTYEDTKASAKLACLELLLGGTTSILDMGTVHHTDALFEAARDCGIRASIGKAMMDIAAPNIPSALQEKTSSSIDESNRLCAEWHDRSDGRLKYAYAPRFALSCTKELLEATCVEARKRGARLHTHASENQDEIAAVKEMTGKDNIEYLQSVGLLGNDVGLAHCIWLNENETRLLKETKTHVLHCPSSNLKLGSGIASIPKLLLEGISVSLGADGAPCANNLDAFLEMRIAALIQKPQNGAKSLPAYQALKLTTRGGANALGLSKQIGSLERGKKADMIAVALNTPHVVPSPNPYSALVYAAKSSDVKHVAVDGQLLVQDGAIRSMDKETVLVDAHMRGRALRERI